MKKILIFFIVVVFLVGLLIEGSWASASPSGSSLPSGHEATTVAVNQCPEKIEKHSDELGKKLPLWAILPFVGILLSIAIFPLAAPHFWHHHYSKVTAFWSVVFAAPFIYFFHNHAVYEILHIYRSHVNRCVKSI